MCTTRPQARPRFFLSYIFYSPTGLGNPSLGIKLGNIFFYWANGPFWSSQPLGATQNEKLRNSVKSSLKYLFITIEIIKKLLMDSTQPVAWDLLTSYRHYELLPNSPIG